MEKNNKQALTGQSIRTAWSNSVESELGCSSTLTSQKAYQHNNKLDYSETNGYNIPQDAINDIYIFSIKYR